MSTPILYTIHCPKCNVIRNKLEKKSIPYTMVEDVEVIKSKGITEVPVLEVDGERMYFLDIDKWIRQQPDASGKITESKLPK